MEWDVLLYLAGHTDYDSGVAIHRNGYHVTAADITRESGLSEKSVGESLLKLESKEIIGRFILGDDKRKYSYLVNPFCFVKGVKINATLVEIFKTSKYYRSGWLQERDECSFLIGYKNKGCTFSKIWICILPEIISAKLSKSVLMVLFYCASRIQYFTGIIAYSNGRKCSVDNIANDCSIKKRCTREALNALKEFGLIDFGFEKDKQGAIDDVIYFNPFVAAKGKNCDLSLTEKFKDTPFAKRYIISNRSRESNSNSIAQKTFQALMV